MGSPRSWLIAYAATFAVFTVIDAVWIVSFAADLFKRHIAPVMRPDFDLTAALALYVIYAAGICYLAIRPAGHSTASAARHGAVLGFVAYAIFDLTNLAIIKGWTLGLAIVDMTWGTVATAIAATIGHAVASRTGAVTGRNADASP